MRLCAYALSRSIALAIISTRYYSWLSIPAIISTHYVLSLLTS